MKFAYADPPYLGTAQRTYGKSHESAADYDDPATHRELIERLNDEFDGWALSLNEPSLPVILPMAPSDARVGIWISHRPKFPPLTAVGRHWEPVIFRGYRGGPRRCPDYCITAQGGSVRSEASRVAHRATSSLSADGRFARRVRSGRETFGSKPRLFCHWIFDFLGIERHDEFHDLFPGSGAVSAVWAERCDAQPDLPLTPIEVIAARGAS